MSRLLLVTVVVAAIDLFTKVVVSSTLDSPVDLWSVVTLRLSSNSGVAFGLGAGQPSAIVVSLTALVTAVLVWICARTHVSPFAGGLLLGGALGNLADRVRGDGVVDFIDLGWWPSFNLADVALTSGCLMLALTTTKPHGEADGASLTARPPTPRPHRMPLGVRQRLELELTQSRQADDPWPNLERAHILSQPWAWQHTRVHWRMLTTALRTHDRREALGQILRLVVAGPGSLTGRYPTGNTGRANMPLTQPAPLPRDLADLLDAT